MVETRHYDNMADRQVKVAKLEALGLTMLHDDFDPNWQSGDEPHGTLTFDYPLPKTAEQLADEAEEKALAKADQLIDAISNLAEDKVFLKRLCARLIRKGVLP